MNKIYTFGYEGLSAQDFIERLVITGVERVIDVRALPLSRKKGLSKRSLAEGLSERGINYEHVKAVGCPKNVRNRYREDRDWSAYTNSYLRYLETQRDAIDEISKMCRLEVCCLICFEADFSTCHRMYVARALAKIDESEIKHISQSSILSDPECQAAA